MLSPRAWQLGLSALITEGTDEMGLQWAWVERAEGLLVRRWLLSWKWTTKALPCGQHFQGFPSGSDGKESACNAGDPGSIPGWEKSPGEREWLPTPVFLPGEFQDRGVWRATVHGVALIRHDWATNTCSAFSKEAKQPCLPWHTFESTQPEGY